MTKSEFEKTKFSKDTKVIYKGNIFEVVAVDFEDLTICIKIYGRMYWESINKFTLKS